MTTTKHITINTLALFPHFSFRLVPIFLQLAHDKRDAAESGRTSYRQVKDGPAGHFLPPLLIVPYTL